MSGKRVSSYRSYLLRLRRGEIAGRSTWRASLQEPGSQTEVYFDSLAALFSFLTEQLSAEVEVIHIEDE